MAASAASCLAKARRPIKKKPCQRQGFSLSGRRDLNPRPPEPHSGALPGCATSRSGVLQVLNLAEFEAKRHSHNNIHIPALVRAINEFRASVTD